VANETLIEALHAVLDDATKPSAAKPVKIVRCEMDHHCNEPVTHLDNKGFVYCAKHGVARRSFTPCRKLLASEIRKLQRGEALKRY
jgi:hypothetical protein